MDIHKPCLGPVEEVTLEYVYFYAFVVFYFITRMSFLWYYVISTHEIRYQII
jgi:hypothetical protein